MKTVVQLSGEKNRSLREQRERTSKESSARNNPMSSQLPQYPSSQNGDLTLSKSDMHKLWLAMIRIYGANLWCGQFGDEDNGLWREGLTGLTWEDVKRGIRECTRSPTQYPPNLPTFRAYCKPPAKFIKPQELPVVNLELAEQAIKECRRILKTK